MKRIAAAAAAVALFAVPIFAHHGKDFLFVESFEIPHPRTFFFVTSEQFARSDFHDQPTLLFGVTDMMAGSIHIHLDRHSIESIAPSVHVRLADSGPWHLGAAAEYEIARSGENDNVALRLVGGRSIGEGALIVNAGVQKERHGSAHPIYAVGFRPDLEAHLGWGLELRRGEEDFVTHEILAGVYAQPNERITIKAGAGAEVGHGKPAAVIRTGFVWRF